MVSYNIFISASKLRQKINVTSFGFVVLCISVAIGFLVLILAVVFFIVIIRYVRKNRNVSASYKRTFAKAGSADELMEDAMVVISDEEL